MQCGSESVAVHSWNATGIDVLQSKVRASVGVCVCFVGLCTSYTQVSVYSFSWTNPFKDSMVLNDVVLFEHLFSLEVDKTRPDAH